MRAARRGGGRSRIPGCHPARFPAITCAPSGHPACAAAPGESRAWHLPSGWPRGCADAARVQIAAAAPSGHRPCSPGEGAAWPAWSGCGRCRKRGCHPAWLTVAACPRPVISRVTPHRALWRGRATQNFPPAAVPARPKPFVFRSPAPARAQVGSSIASGDGVASQIVTPLGSPQPALPTMVSPHRQPPPGTPRCPQPSRGRPGCSLHGRARTAALSAGSCPDTPPRPGAGGVARFRLPRCYPARQHRPTAPVRVPVSGTDTWPYRERGCRR